MQPFIHLHVHSQYSILDGQASIPALVDKAIRDGMKGLALTDHGNMFGIKEFFNLVKKKNGATKDAIKGVQKRIEAIESGAEEVEKKRIGPPARKKGKTRSQNIQADIRMRNVRSPSSAYRQGSHTERNTYYRR